MNHSVFSRNNHGSACSQDLGGMANEFSVSKALCLHKKFQFAKKKFIASELRGCGLFLNLLIIFFTDAFFFGAKKTIKPLCQIVDLKFGERNEERWRSKMRTVFLGIRLLVKIDQNKSV